MTQRGLRLLRLLLNRHVLRWRTILIRIHGTFGSINMTAFHVSVFHAATLWMNNGMTEDAWQAGL